MKDYRGDIALLDSEDLKTRWDAVVRLARMPALDDWALVWEAIDSRIAGESSKELRGFMAQALSMTTARNMPESMLYGHVSDFLLTYDEFWTA